MWTKNHSKSKGEKILMILRQQADYLAVKELDAYHMLYPKNEILAELRIPLLKGTTNILQ